MNQNDIQIRAAGEGDLEALTQISKNGAGYFKRCMEEQRTVLFAALAGKNAGYGILNWNPRYNLYRKFSIPEIQDLNVLPEARKKGVATAMIAYCEKQAAAKGCETIGISVGLHSGFGAAQRLYVKLGYVPDGFGVTYDRQPVTAGELRPIDDDLCLMMVKVL